jgi:DNA (cytosine-5)-methyltransferase 1
MASRLLRSRSPSVVSLFSGAGGLDIGLEMAGFHTVAAVDFDPECASTLRENKARRVTVPGSDRTFLSRTRIIEGSIYDVGSDQLRPPSVGEEWCPDLLAGGPPCQPFSSSGKQLGVADPRGRLFEEFVRVARDLRPKYILFENVRGLVTQRGLGGRPGEVLDMVKADFEAIGYATTFRVLNAADFGAPQRRVRLFMLGARVAPLPTFPSPTHAASPDLSCEPWVTLGAFLKSFRPSVSHDEAIVRPSARLASLLAGVPEGSGLKSAGAREATRPGGHWGYKQGTFIADPNKPARTVTAAATQDWLRLPDGSVRRLTTAECAALQGFPQEWHFAGDMASRFRQIGNAVPTYFGLVLGRAILAALEKRDECVRPISAPLPPEIRASIDYTKREEARNGESRQRVRAARAQSEEAAAALKGIGRDTGKGHAGRRPRFC